VGEMQVASATAVWISVFEMCVLTMDATCHALLVRSLLLFFVHLL